MASAFNNAFDYSIVHYLNSMVGRCAIFDQAMLFVIGNALIQGALYISFFWYYWFKKTNIADIKRTREHLLATMAAGVVAIVLARSLALSLPFRIRPRFDPSVHFVLPEGADRGSFWNWSAFPSDHAVMFAALATGLFYISWRAGLLSLLYISVVILFPRLYLGIHYASDLLVGSALGTMCGVCANLPSLRERISSRMVRFEHTSPGAFYVAMFVAMFLFATMFDSLREAAHSAWHLLVQLTGAHRSSSVASVIGK
jgi:undecaprenyl-diphosphatase